MILRPKHGNCAGQKLESPAFCEGRVTKLLGLLATGATAASLACSAPASDARAPAASGSQADAPHVLLDRAEPSAMAAAVETVCTLAPVDWRILSAQARAVALQHNWDDSGKLVEAALELAVDRSRRTA